MSWDERVARFWAAADDAEPDRMRRDFDALVVERRADDPEVLFERASLEDFLGEEARAIPLYRAALEGGLPDEHRTAATIQLASSLRNVGQPSAAMALLQHVPLDDPLSDAAQAFLSLALLDDAKPGPALRTALHALAPHLRAYGRAIEHYADEVVSPPRARNVVVALVVRDGQVLAEEYTDADGGLYLRAPGGGLEFGERVADGIRRELDEELAADVREARLIAVTENIFTRGRKRGHEIVHVFAVRSDRLEALPFGSRLPVLDSDTHVAWYRLADLSASGPPFYPDGILDLAEQIAADAG
ncbi:tetratricopeptide repeat protein [Microbacterium telephonicum]|uniref:ADP-ribose pyrophosphatase YjhB (NUDIX family) n=1 Tax=Microbacterium telephonicum TaxID=1714841 RepID=A0A498C3L3_9MICO|nr:tetratricopeptide repeat protein [Microbacterium telephonicum]RLK49176.1 ADP-ribose pyrophosphatase YjhB (NUDIX family) [Microbacterium telephonicum]